MAKSTPKRPVAMDVCKGGCGQMAPVSSLRYDHGSSSFDEWVLRNVEAEFNPICSLCLVQKMAEKSAAWLEGQTEDAYHR